MGGFEAAGTLLRGVYEELTGPGLGIVMSFLAWVFVVSGIAKLRRPALTAMAVVDFGVTRRVVPRLGIALGAVELALGAALMLRILPAVTLALTCALLGAFVFVVGRALVQKRSFPCYCFGDSDRDLSLWTLARAGALAALAALAVLGGPGTVEAALRTRALQEIAAASVFGAAVMAAFVPRLVRWNADAMKVLRSTPS